MVVISVQVMIMMVQMLKVRVVIIVIVALVVKAFVRNAASQCLKEVFIAVAHNAISLFLVEISNEFKGNYLFQRLFLSHVTI